jgi:tRNA A37 N6-isopentenylltransferase MiaA
VLGRGRVPVVVGGTPMYTQWLVEGKPDAPRWVRRLMMMMLMIMMMILGI